jgi:gliding motility-associated-like protein
MMVKDSGRYSVVKSYTKICSRDTTSLVVHVRHAPPIAATISADALVLCKGSSMFLHANGGSLLGDQAISWTKDNVLSAVKDATMQISEPGSYIIEITNDIEGCRGRDTLVVAGEYFTVSLPERKGMTEGSRATLLPFIQPANAGYAFQWSPPYAMLSGMDEQNALVAPLSDTVYTVTVTSPNGCIQQASTLVYVIDKMHIPTAFSPDNDGHNDRFEIFNAKDQIVEMRIYNRWGELIHFSKGYTTPWDGQYKNAPVPAGSYPYVIKTNEREVTGTVMLLK